MIIGVLRMVLFWLASSYDYQAITYALIISYVASAALMMGMARMEYRNLVKKAEESALNNS